MNWAEVLLETLAGPGSANAKVIQSNAGTFEVQLMLSNLVKVSYDGVLQTEYI